MDTNNYNAVEGSESFLAGPNLRGGGEYTWGQLCFYTPGLNCHGRNELTHGSEADTVEAQQIPRRALSTRE
jgi:hypothetical protein